jgi:hypothetical protein
LRKSVLRSRRPWLRSADTTDTTDTFAANPYMCERACVRRYYKIVSVVSVVSTSGLPCGFERRTLFSQGVLYTPKCPPFDLWSMEAPAPGEDARRVAWHIAYLLAGEMDAEERAELNRLRRVQRWLSVAPERRAALRLALIASAAVWMSTPHATGPHRALNLSPRQQRWTLRQHAQDGRGGQV